MSLDDQIDTPAATNGNGTSGADEPGAMDEQYAAFQASTANDDTAPPGRCCTPPAKARSGSATPAPAPTPRKSRSRWTPPRGAPT